jgi:hypothetical protein
LLVKKLIIAALALVVAAPLTAATAGPEQAQLRVVVCHKTKSAANPYTRIVVTTNAARRAHLAHPGDIVPAGGPCPRTRLTATSGGTAIAAPLVGVAERPEPGDADGTGAATIRVRRNQGEVCFRLAVEGIGAAAAAHIHRGDATVAGPVAVTLRTPNAAGQSSGCVAAPRSLVNQILTNRAGFYVNVHTSDFPGGAVRGQLGASSNVRLLSADLTGAAEVPPADANGRGVGRVRFQEGDTQVCFTLSAQSIRLPAAAAHIHRGVAGQNGPVVVAFVPPDANGVSRGCATASATLIGEILANPAGFYVNVHTSQFPGGAVRGQLG